MRSCPGTGVSRAFSHLQAVPPSSGGGCPSSATPGSIPFLLLCPQRAGDATQLGTGLAGGHCQRCSSPSFGGAGSPKARQPPMVPGSCPGWEPAGLSPRRLRVPAPFPARPREGCHVLGKAGRQGGRSACPGWGTALLPLGTWSSPRGTQGAGVSVAVLVALAPKGQPRRGSLRALSGTGPRWDFTLSWGPLNPPKKQPLKLGLLCEAPSFLLPPGTGVGLSTPRRRGSRVPPAKRSPTLRLGAAGAGVRGGGEPPRRPRGSREEPGRACGGTPLP